MFKRILPLLVTGLVVWQYQSYRRNRQLQRQEGASKAKPAEVTTWEGEGGALRGSGSQLGPAPTQS
ncbi:MAG: hypothetical protein IV097_18415 [Burkholderiaceae bacterium]|nr:hypothetical protein [Burkholderiaceae bacterium]